MLLSQADATLLKAQIRAGTAYWRLGNFEAAADRYKAACSGAEAPQEAAQKLAALQDFAARVEQVWLLHFSCHAPPASCIHLAPGMLHAGACQKLSRVRVGMASLVGSCMRVAEQHLAWHVSSCTQA